MTHAYDVDVREAGTFRADHEADNELTGNGV